MPENYVKGAPISLRNHLLNRPAGRYADGVTAWLAQNPGEDHAIWRHGRPTEVLEWRGSRWSTSGLAEHIVREAMPDESPSLVGPDWWMTEDGTSLSSLAGRTATVPRDWSDLHELLSTLQPGEWTSYGRLAEAIGTGAQAVGNHVTSCLVCPAAWRVLGADGRSREGFRWVNPEERRSQQKFLEAEGLNFVDDFADPDKRVPVEQLFTRLSTA